MYLKDLRRLSMKHRKKVGLQVRLSKLPELDRSNKGFLSPLDATNNHLKHFR